MGDNIMDVHTNTNLLKMYTGIAGNTLRTALFGLVGTMAIIAFADVSQYRLALTALIISLAVFGVLRSRGPIEMLSLLAKDMPEETANTNFGKAFADTPFGMFKIIIAVSLIVTAVLQIWAVW